MPKIIEIPIINKKMKLLHCDQCEATSLNLYMNEENTCLAYKCVSCNFIGYYHYDLGEDDV